MCAPTCRGDLLIRLREEVMSATTLQLGVWAGTVIVRESGNSRTTVTLCTGGGVKERKPLACYYNTCTVGFKGGIVRLVNIFGGYRV